MFTVAFIGAGKMAQALAAAMQQAGLLSGVRAVDPVPEAIDQLSKRLGNALRVEEHPSAAAAAEGADASFLAVKPQDVASATADLGETATLIVSIMAGVSLASLREPRSAPEDVVRLFVCCLCMSWLLLAPPAPGD